MANITRMLSIMKTGRLMYVDYFIHFTVQECVLYVKLMNGKVAICRKAKDNIYGGRFDNLAKGLVIVNSGSLVLSICY